MFRTHARVLRPRRLAAAATVAAVLVLVLAVSLSGALSTGGAGRAPLSGTAAHGVGRQLAQAAAANHERYGGLPSWLPRPRVHVNRLLTASVAHPALAIQGTTVAVALSGGRVLATAAGPEVPEEGRFPVPATSPCTFVVTLAAAAGAVPLDPAAFTLVDDLGHVHRPQVTVLHGGTLPRALSPGRTVSLRLYDVLPTGDGALEWAPGGGRPLVGWDYTVEID
jgi:hypothetical protein